MRRGFGTIVAVLFIVVIVLGGWFLFLHEQVSNVPQQAQVTEVKTKDVPWLGLYDYSESSDASTSRGYVLNITSFEKDNSYHGTLTISGDSAAEMNIVAREHLGNLAVAFGSSDSEMSFIPDEVLFTLYPTGTSTVEKLYPIQWTAYTPLDPEKGIFRGLEEYRTVVIPNASTWSTYESSAFGLSLHYPSDFSLKEDTAKTTFTIPTSIYFSTILGQQARIAVFKPAKVCPEPDKNGITLSKSKPGETFSVGALSVDKYVWGDSAMGHRSTNAAYVTHENSLCYVISFQMYNGSSLGFYTDDEAIIKDADTRHAAEEEQISGLADSIVKTLQINTISAPIPKARPQQY